MVKCHPSFYSSETYNSINAKSNCQDEGAAKGTYLFETASVVTGYQNMLSIYNDYMSYRNMDLEITDKTPILFSNLQKLRMSHRQFISWNL